MGRVLAAMGLVLGGLTTVTGCGSGGSGGGGGFTDLVDWGYATGGGSPTGVMGATQGGVQDMGLARALVDAGQVPPAAAFVVEGMFSEYDLGLQGPPPDARLSLTPGLGIAPAADGTSAAWLQLAMSSDLDPDTWQRPTVGIVFCLDVSGSMGWDYQAGDLSTPLPAQLAGKVVVDIARKLATTDRIAIVTFAERATKVYGSVPGGDPDRVVELLRELTYGGSTDLAQGLDLAFAVAAQMAPVVDEPRVLLLSDQQPTLGLNRQVGLDAMIADAAAQGIGLTAVSIGLGLAPELTDRLSANRGGNAFTVFDEDDVDRLVAEQWPHLATPLAYDLRVQAALPAGWSMAESFGFGSGVGADAVNLTVTTVFPSGRRGALLLCLTPPAGVWPAPFTVGGSLRYELPDGTAVERTFSSAYAGQAVDAGGRWFEQRGVGRTVALALLVSAMRTAAEQYASSREAAAATLNAALLRFQSDLAALGADPIADELDFGSQLLALMRAGAEQGSLYGAVEF